MYSNNRLMKDAENTRLRIYPKKMKLKYMIKSIVFWKTDLHENNSLFDKLKTLPKMIPLN